MTKSVTRYMIDAARDDGSTVSKEYNKAMWDRLAVGTKTANAIITKQYKICEEIEVADMPTHGVRREGGVLVYDEHRAEIDKQTEQMAKGESA